MKMLIVDCNNICHIAKHSLGDLRVDEVKTGVIFGFMRQVLALSKTFSTNQFVFAWDVGPLIRKELFPEYKANRGINKSEEDKWLDEVSLPQFAAIRDHVLPSIGFRNILYCDGFEADDIIAKLVIDGDDAKSMTVISADSDLYQLLDHCSVYSTVKKEETTKESFVRKYGIQPSEWVDVKAIAGDSSDNIPGVAGVGEKTALKYVRGELGHKTKKYQDIVDGKEIIDRNRNLMTIPLSSTPDLVLKDDEFSFDGFYDVCESLHFNTMIEGKMLREWQERFGLE